MSDLPGSNLLSLLEPGLLGITWCVSIRSRSYRRFPAFFAFLSCRLCVYLVLTVILRTMHSGWIGVHEAYAAYYYIYWLGYLTGAAMVFLVIQAIFGHVIEPFPGLHRIGLIGFRWATATAVLVAIAMAIFPIGANQDLLIVVASGVMRCMSILKLCLLAFILLSMQSLRVSPRSREFGISLGMAMIAMAELGGAAFAFNQSTMASVANYVSQIVMTLATAVWAAYFVGPAVERGAIVVPQSSPLLRWNEVASALEKPPPQVILGAPSSSFFLQDVEKAVDRVMERNARNSGD
jgi:hypothetical protein